MAIILVFLEFGHVFAHLGDYPKLSTVEGPLQNIPAMSGGHERKIGLTLNSRFVNAWLIHGVEAAFWSYLF